MGRVIKRSRGRPKPKSRRADVTSAMGSKRRLSRFGKEQRPGKRGVVAQYITRSRVLRKLDLSLHDFRRLCILKGIYPREPKKKREGGHRLYYHVKDISFLSHEPLLERFRSLATTMKRVRRALGQKNRSEAKRIYAARPVVTLDHLVRERYPRFVDALADMDDAMSLISIFASLSASRGVSADVIAKCSRLVREWEAFVVASRTLRKVFLSIKGIYFQAEAEGVAITWLAPYSFSQRVPRDVDLHLMSTFVDFYLVAVEFVLFKLYTGRGLRYPPPVRGDVDERGGRIAAVDLTRSAAASLTVNDAVVAGPAVVSEAAMAERLHLAAVDAEADDDDADGVAEPATDNAAAGAEEDVAFGDSAEAVALRSEVARLHQLTTLFDGLTFFLSREVPRDAFEFIVIAFGGRVVWDGDGDSQGVTHVVLDRPMTGIVRVSGREYVQPQWIVDSINASIRLPVARYAPGAVLPPHLSPFVDDASEGYIPAYREELDRLRSAAEAVHGVPAAVEDEAAEGEGDSDTSGGDSDSDGDADAGAEGNGDSYVYAGAVVDVDASEEAPVAAPVESKDTVSASRRTMRAARGESATSSKESELSRERRQLAEMMLTKKRRRMYQRVSAAIERHKAEAAMLHQKRREHEAAAAPGREGKRRRVEAER